MKSSIHFGAGNIGRGFIGAVLESSGYHVLFADVNEEIIRSINEGRGYSVRITDLQPAEQRVSNVSAILTGDPALPGLLAGADLITTAVGLTILPRIAPDIADGISARLLVGNTRPLNVIACENGIGATSLLRGEVFKHLNDSEKVFAEANIGFADCSVDRIVPPARYGNPADVAVERFYEWNVDLAALKGELPRVEGMNLVDNLQAYTERKLFTLNTGHAVAAYLGRLRGYDTVDEAIADPEILDTVRGAMQESGLALILKYRFEADVHSAYIGKIIDRFRNPCLHDELARVCREPLRKLSPADRLIKPFSAARAYGIETPNLLRGIAAALCYDNPGDEQSVRMRQMLGGPDMREAVSAITGLAAASPEVGMIIAEYENLKK